MYEAIILAGGFGTRLREAVPDLPKPMAPIAGKPFLAWQLDYLMQLGVRRFILSVGYKALTISDYFGDEYQGAEIVYAEETEPLGTGGAIQYALTKATRTRVFVLNGDTLCATDLGALRALTNSHPDAVGIAVKHVDNAGRYGAIAFDEKTRLVTRFGEKSSANPGFINAGIYDVPANLFDDIVIATPFSFEVSVIQHLVGSSLYAQVSGDFFIDIGIKEDFLNAQTLIPAFVEQ
ncbi:MAG: nucleotidyltransferase family protein [Pseudomonadota bacterium]|nr:nucleotidyltransferase family protein [Pseudomonadota bacterium]